jgi:hypothetical protein
VGCGGGVARAGCGRSCTCARPAASRTAPTQTMGSSGRPCWPACARRPCTRRRSSSSSWTRGALIAGLSRAYRWPAPAADWGPAAPAPVPVAQRAGPPTKQWRISGALNALTGQVTDRDASLMGRERGRERVSAFYHQHQLVATSPPARRLYVGQVQDTWSIHTHPEVLATVDRRPQVTPVWLPTYAPWLNPIERLRSCGAGGARTCCACRACRAWPATGRPCTHVSTPFSLRLPRGRTPCCTVWASGVTVDLLRHDGPQDSRF